ncbi:MAG: hypothetical protein ACYCSO_02730 [Cuniculiplasma sp.]
MDFVTTHHLLPSNLFGYTSFTVNLILLLIGIALSFRGEKSWKVIMLALGAYGGFVITAYILVRFHFTGLPTILIFAIGAVIGAVLFKFLAEIAICASIGFTVFIGLAYVTGAGVVVAGIAALIAFAFTYYRFNKVVIYVAGFAGALAIWIALYGLGLPDISAQVFAAAAMIIGISMQKYEENQDKINNRRVRSDY